MKESSEALALGVIGAIQGVFREVIQPELTAERTWVGLGVVIGLHEALCGSNEMLSHGVDRMIEKHPVATRLAIGVTALHLANLLPEKIDPISRFANLVKR